jgi:uncharacterized protein YndB with AHSA1/START domain
MAAEASNEADREIVVSRIIEGPRRLVFDAFTSDKYLAQWCAPKGGKITTKAFDFKPGGVWDATIEGPDGSAYPNYWKWTEIVPPERITWLYGTGKDAVPTTVTLVEKGAATEVTMRIVYGSKEERDEKIAKYYARQGAQGSLNSLAAYVATLARR